MPLVLGTDKQKLSKRKGALAIAEYRALGYLPEALLNMVSMVGWNPGTEQEVFSKEALVETFELSKVQKSPAVFNEEKLNWFNREYIKKLDQKEFWTHAHVWLPMWIGNVPTTHEILKKIEYLIRDRIEKFSDIQTLFEDGEFDYFFKEPIVDEKMLIWKNLKDDAEGMQKTKNYLHHIVSLLEPIPDGEWNHDHIKHVLMEYADKEGKGNVLWPFRVTLSWQGKIP